MIKRSNLCTALLDKVVNIPVIQITLLVILFILVSMFSLSAQTPRKDSGADGLTKINRLYVGDTVPDELWNAMLPVANHPEGKEYIQLKEYKGKKLILIDCWATTCKSCLEGLPKIQKLQHTYSDVSFLLATLQQDRAPQYLKDNGYTLTSFIDTRATLFQYFPYTWIPYYIWISGGKVVATTQATEVTDENIAKLLNEGIAPTRVRQDRVSFDLKDNFLNDPLIFRKPQLQHSFTITGYLQDVLAQTNYKIGKDGKPSFFGTTNAGPIDIYKSAIAIARPDLRKGNWFLLETKWRDKLLNVSTDQYRADSTAHLYAIQFYSAAADKSELAKDLLQELNTFFGQKYGMEGRIEQRSRKAYVIRKDASSQGLKIPKKLTKELPLYQLVDRLDNESEQTNTSIPWINKTDEFKKTIKIPDDWPNDLNSINAFLVPQGYRATLETLPMDVFVLGDIAKGGRHE
ncbi:TlpA disulfide reductase family protein [Sphingobacterium sp. UME9]|uniref:TlpA family protein disulfide reductase n=1 Tax=Sphingobacterium sp. UME9 TaxID=1862316 RepID=UPI0016005D71|nr:TlpA disulfide reductase family protein [Sphingobacterium sp. UME9]